jgi:hypothetical protein
MGHGRLPRESRGGLLRVLGVDGNDVGIGDSVDVRPQSLDFSANVEPGIQRIVNLDASLGVPLVTEVFGSP